MVGTQAFADAVIARLGAQPTALAPVEFREGAITVTPTTRPRAVKTRMGVDVFLDWNSVRPVLGLLGQLHQAGFDVIKTEHLYAFDGQPAYSLGQGE